MKIGTVIAIEREFKAFQKTLGEIPTLVENVGGHRIFGFRFGNHDMYAVQSGAGEIHAAAATQALITRFKVDMIFNFGVCGGLVSDMSLFKTVAVRDVVHYDFDTSPVDGWEKGRYPEYPSVYIPASPQLLPERVSIPKVTCASGDRFIANQNLKKRLAEEYGAKICDMEAAGILLTANAAGVPALLVKVVSDSLTGGPEEYQQRVDKAASICMDVLKNLEEKKND